MIGFVRAVLFYVVFFGGTFCLSAAGTVVYLVAPTKIRTFAVLWARLGVWAARAVCDIRLEVTGMENIPEGPALIASRHQSAFADASSTFRLPLVRRSVWGAWNANVTFTLSAASAS